MKFVLFFISLESFFPVRCLGGSLAEGRESRTRLMLFFHSLYTLDSTKKVSDVLKLFEDGEMADYLQGDVSGSWEILSLTNSSHLCFCYSIGIPSFQRLFWAHPLLSFLEIPHHPLLRQLLLSDKARYSINSGLSPRNHTPVLDASQPCIYCLCPHYSQFFIPQLPSCRFLRVMLALIIGHWV